MASDRKKTSTSASGNGGSVPITKRPARTIELEAEDVTAEDAPKKDSPRDSKAEDAKEPEESQNKPDKDSDASGEDDARPDAGSPSPPPEQRTKPAEIKSFVTHLAAGLAGGLIGVIGAGIALDRIPVTPGDNAGLVERLSAVETRLAALPAGDQTSDVLEAAGKLETRITALEKKPPGESPEIKDMAARLGKLEGTLKTLREAGAQEGASGVAQSAALTGRIDEVSTQLETRLDGLKEDMAALRKALETSVTSSARESTKTANALAERIGSFEKKIATLDQTIAEAAAPTGSLSAASGDGAALALAFESLRRTAGRGHAYADHLKALRDLAPDGVDLSPFEAEAATGVATEGELLTALPGVLKAARAAIATQESSTFLDRVVSNARSVVRVRRIGPSEGEGPDAVLSRMEAQMKASNLAGVLREAKGLKGAVLDAVQPWMDRANARRASEDQLDRLGRQLLGALQTTTKRKR